MEETLIKRIMPHSYEAEQSIVGAMMMDQEAISLAAEKLIPDDFYNPGCRVLFETMVELQTDGKPCDLVTLQNKLREKETPPELNDVSYLSNIIASVPTSANAKYYADIVKEKAILRRLIKVTEGITNECYSDNEDIDSLLDTTERQIFDVVQNKTTADFTPIREVALQSLDSIQAAAKNKGNVTGLSTGFYDLDYKTAGFQPSDLILIAARPSMGKTAFVLNIAEYMALHQGTTTAIFSLEMSKDQLVKRLISMHSKVDSQNIRSGNLSPEDWIKITESVRAIGESNLVIDDTPGITVAQLRSKCRKLKIEQNLGIVIIDYLQLMSGGKRSESRQQEISEISRSLKALAREIDCPVVALSQLSRAVEGRENKRPMLSDLRESGAIEQDADVVMFIYRDDYYNKDSDEKGVSEIIIGKQRNGPTCTVKLAWLADYTKFANLDVEH
jgi:replicative DNA helicase